MPQHPPNNPIINQFLAAGSMAGVVAKLVNSSGLRPRFFEYPHDFALPSCFVDLCSAACLAFHQSSPSLSGFQFHERVDPFVRGTGGVEAEPGEKACFAIRLGQRRYDGGHCEEDQLLVRSDQYIC